MKKIFFFGTGYCAKKFANKVKLALDALGEYCILGFLDNDKNKIGTTFEGYKVYNPDVLKESYCDLVLIFLMNIDSYETVRNQLSRMISPEALEVFTYPLKRLLQIRYADTDDAEIRETIKYISDHDITVFNQFITSEHTYDEVKWDKQAELPYIDFTTIEGKKVPMYYPRNFNFVNRDGVLFKENLLWEQSEGSPHLYIKGTHMIVDGDRIIDAGVCEGNFALRYVNVASHLYLFEADPVWIEPLRHTFRNYENKTTIIGRAVSDRTSNQTCRIDDIVRGDKINFVKMDIEGAELPALRGAENTFRTNNIRSSICCYHKHGDERAIRLQLKEYGYETTVSEGWMLFLHADDTWKFGDLRRGIVYGERGQ